MYTVERVYNLNQRDLKQAADVWELAVRATHTFLDTAYIDKLAPAVADVLAGMPCVYCARNETDDIIGFIGISGKAIELLFVIPDEHRRGIGTALVLEAIKKHGVNAVDVNEQNIAAIKFYKFLGFEAFTRSDTDDLGEPYPILHMRR